VDPICFTIILPSPCFRLHFFRFTLIHESSRQCIYPHPPPSPFFPTPSRPRVGVHQSLTLGRSLTAPTLQILLSLTLIRYLPGLRDPQTGHVYMDFASLFGSRSYHFIMHLLFTLVHLHSFFFAPCFAISHRSTRCSVDCRLLPNYRITTLGTSIILYQHL